MNKSCAQLAKEYVTLKKMRELAKKSTLLDGNVYVLFMKANGEYLYVIEGDSFIGKMVEYIYPY